MFRTFLVTLLAATVLWGVLFYGSIQEWRRYVKDYYEWCQIEHQRLLEEFGLYASFALPQSYLGWNGGGIILVTGFVLLCAWILTAREKLLESKKSLS